MSALEFDSKHCEYNSEDEDNSLIILIDKVYQASSQKFIQTSIFLSEIGHFLIKETC